MSSKYIKIFSNKGGNDSKECLKIIYKIYINYLKRTKTYYELIKKTKCYILIKYKNNKIINLLKNESGLHKIVRYSPYKKNSLQTSYCTVFIYNFKEYNEKSITFKRKDLKIDTFKSSGAGGQSVNKTNSAVRIKHLPTGIKVECQKERSQHINKKIAFFILEDKIKKNFIINKEKNINNNSIKRIYYFNKSLVVDKTTNKKCKINKILKGFIEKLY
ncbi:peptide chain release factor-like protein [Candidatus Vidania fulgoroideorum]